MGTKRKESGLKLSPELISEIERLIDERIKALYVTREDFNELKEIVKEMGNSILKLAEAQRKTEENLNQLIIEHRRIEDVLDELLDISDYVLGNKVMLYMREFVRDEYGIEAEVIEPKDVVYPDGRYDEVNIYVEGHRNDEKVYVIGECKSRPSKREVDKLVEKRERLRDYLKSDAQAFIVGYSFSPEVEVYLREEHLDVKMFKSYEFELRYGRRV